MRLIRIGALLTEHNEVNSRSRMRVVLLISFLAPRNGRRCNGSCGREYR